MTLYTVKYRKAGSFFWHTIRRVKGDVFIPNTLIMQIIQVDETNTEINLVDHEVRYSKERFMSIKERQASEAGQKINIEKR